MDSPAVFLSKLTEGDIPEIVKLEQAIHTAPWTEKSFKNELTNPHSIFWVAKTSGQVIGYAGAWTLVDEAHITNVAVDPTFRRQGIGRKLVNELLGRSLDAGMTCATLEVRASNQAAIELYKGFGFVEASIRRKYYPDNNEDAVIMWLYDLPAQQGQK